MLELVVEGSSRKTARRRDFEVRVWNFEVVV
jgi:hypothetical protein